MKSISDEGKKISQITFTKNEVRRKRTKKITHDI
jgi:hypothetical protein